MFLSFSHVFFCFQAGCFKGDFLLSSDRLVEGFCANMLREVHEIQHAGYPVLKRDLFMEQRQYSSYIFDSFNNQANINLNQSIDTNIYLTFKH